MSVDMAVPDTEAPVAPTAAAPDTVPEEKKGLFRRGRRPSPVPAAQRPAPVEPCWPSPQKADREAERAARRKVWARRREVAADVGVDSAFYLIFLFGALYGQFHVYTHLFALPEWLAWPVSVALELAGVKFLRDAAKQRAVGETGAFALFIAYSCAAAVIGLNAVGHLVLGDKPGALIFGLLSALAFFSFTIRAEFRKRQADREDGRRAQTTPRYGLGRWVRDYKTTRLAKELAGQDKELGLYGSLEAAAAKIEQERVKSLAKQRAEKLLELLHDNAKVRYRDYPLLADIEVNSHDPEAIAQILMDRADNTKVAEDIIGRMEAEQARMAKGRTKQAAAELASNYAPNETPNSAPNKGRKVGRILGRNSAEKHAEFAPNEGPNSTPNKGRKSIPNQGPKNAESRPEISDVNGGATTLAPVDKDEEKRRAKAWIAKEIGEGRDPSGTQIESLFAVGSENSKGGTGASLKRQVIADLNKQLEEAVN